MKKAAAILTLSILTLFAAGCSKENDKKVLNVYNWGEYLCDGSEGMPDVIKDFEKWYRETYNENIRVNYSTYPSNEDMYNKVSSGAVNYDVIFPSDYMIARMAEEGLLQPLNFDNIPNSAYINDSFKGLYYDAKNIYSVPYTYGIVGIIYDAEKVKEEDAVSWDLMWNEDYADQILQYNNSRDAFGTAMYKLGIDVNTEDEADWNRAYEALAVQRPLVKSYVMDEIFNMMESGEAAIASYYSGDYFTMREAQSENVDLRFYYPEPTNYFVDAMCIPSSSQNKELGEIFINFMLSRDTAVANAEYLNYSCPNRLVYEDEEYRKDMGEEAMEILYPDTDDFTKLYNKYAYRNLSPQLLDNLNSLWENVKIN